MLIFKLFLLLSLLSQAQENSAVDSQNEGLNKPESNLSRSEQVNTESEQTELPVSETRIGLQEQKKEDSSIHYRIDGSLSFESKNIYLSGQRNNNQPALQNLSLMGTIDLKDNTSASIELLGEQSADTTHVYFGRLVFNYKPFSSQTLELEVGQRYYSFGLLTGEEGLLTRRPSYYQDLLVTRRGIDLGAQIILRPFANKNLSFGYAIYTGQTLRMGDERVESPDSAPQQAFFRWENSWLTTQLTYLHHKYYQRPQFEALGLSLLGAPIPFWSPRVYLRHGVEVWQMSYHRGDQSDRKAETLLLTQELNVYGFFYRLMWSEETWKSNYLPSIKMPFVLHGLGYRLNKYIHFEYQKVLGKEQQSAQTLPMYNEEAYRVVISF